MRVKSEFGLRDAVIVARFEREIDPGTSRRGGRRGHGKIDIYHFGAVDIAAALMIVAAFVCLRSR